MVISRAVVAGCVLALLDIGFAHALPNGTVTYVYTDPQGTPLAEADAQGNITATFDYAPYGTIALGTPPNGPGYTGHVDDPETNLIYMQHRYYDPVTGHFLSVDPVMPTAGNTFSFNRYDYVNNNPIDHIDPDGRTCTLANKTYTCQIDQVVTQENGKNVTRNATDEDHKTYAGLEKALTTAVNAAASSGKTADISFKSGDKTYSFSISGTSVAQNLGGRIIRADPVESGAMDTQGNTTTVDKAGLQPGRTAVGDAERTQEFYFLHEGIHRSSEERKALGFFGLNRMANDQDAHQDSYDAAASSFLGPNQ
ncbi:RHS repeat-associated core domain-containing protein [Dyella silvatica]|uniref:RHS repeat-associated core domain-containing protein n=1 Tax=Dyella silvatica TaxID=2992128 RepID=UPI0022578AFB|nr:RHS repeat-associated core domain-containing protein [Dyella silvatica]